MATSAITSTKMRVARIVSRFAGTENVLLTGWSIREEWNATGAA